MYSLSDPKFGNRRVEWKVIKVTPETSPDEFISQTEGWNIDGISYLACIAAARAKGHQFVTADRPKPLL